MYYVRGSELQDFLRCRLRWNYAWVEGLKAKKPNNKLFFGTLFHKFLEVLYTTDNVFRAEEAWRDLVDTIDTSNMDELEYQDILQLMEKITLGYVHQWASDFQYWEVIATELTFAIPLDDEIGYTGTIDLIVRDKRDGKIYFLDHKTTSSIDKYDKASDLDRQISRYWWALQQLMQGKGSVKMDNIPEYAKETYPDGFIPITHLYELGSKLDAINNNIEIGGFIYNIILKDFPVPPKVLKNGSLSKDKSQKTTYEMYMREMAERNLFTGVKGAQIPDEYREILEHLKDNPKEFFRRLPVHRTQAEIDASIRELYWTARDMMNLIHKNEKNPAFRNFYYRNITHDCTWDCQFKEICQASMDGSNVDYLVDSLFVKDESRSQ